MLIVEEGGRCVVGEEEENRVACESRGWMKKSGKREQERKKKKTSKRYYVKTQTREKKVAGRQRGSQHGDSLLSFYPHKRSNSKSRRFSGFPQ